MKKAGRELRFSIFNLLLFTVVVWPAAVIEAKYSGGSGTASDQFEKDFDIVLALGSLVV